MRHGRVFKHTLGEETEGGPSFNLENLPDPSRIAPCEKFSGREFDYCRLGVALAESCFRMMRADASCRETELDGGIDPSIYADRLNSHEMREGFLWHYARLAEIALVRPQHLPEVQRRIDVLDNATLEDQCIRAFCGECNETGVLFGDDGGVFAGLK